MKNKTLVLVGLIAVAGLPAAQAHAAGDALKGPEDGFRGMLERVLGFEAANLSTASQEPSLNILDDEHWLMGLDFSRGAAVKNDSPTINRNNLPENNSGFFLGLRAGYKF